MEQLLTDYLKKTIAQSIEIDLQFPRNFPEPKLRAATGDEIGRILGDWLRMQGQLMRQQQPAMSEKFLDAAGRALTRAYKMDNGTPPGTESTSQDGSNFLSAFEKSSESVGQLNAPIVLAERPHDPGLLAVLGLYEHDIGDDGKARMFLEEAAKAGMVRPTACLLLGQLRYMEAVTKPLGQDSKLSAKQADFVLEPVKVALGSSATVEAWDLTVETLARSEVRPSSADLGIIVAGVSKFPRDISLALRSAQLCVQAGASRRAAEVIDKSLPFITDENTKQRFQMLRSSLSFDADSR